MITTNNTQENNQTVNNNQKRTGKRKRIPHYLQSSFNHLNQQKLLFREQKKQEQIVNPFAITEKKTKSQKKKVQYSMSFFLEKNDFDGFKAVC